MAKRLYVGNLPYSATELDLVEAFKQFDPESAHVIEGRGFGFIEVPDEKVQEAVEKMHESTIGGRRVIVNEARPRENGGGGGGGGRMGGGGGGGRPGGGGGGGNRMGGGGGRSGGGDRGRGGRW